MKGDKNDKQGRSKPLKTPKTRNEMDERKQIVAAPGENEKRQQKYLTLLSELINMGKFFSRDLEENLRRITEISARIINTERASIWTYNQDYTQIRCEDLFDLSKNAHSKGEVLQSSEFPDYTSAHKIGRVIAAEDVFTDPRTSSIPSAYYNAYGIKSLLDAPVWIHNRLFGLLSFEHVGETRKWRAEEEHLAMTFAAYVSFCFEAHEHRRAEEALRESEERYRIIADHMADVITVMDMNLRFTYVSPSILRVLGFTVEEALTLTLEQILTPGSLQKVNNIFEEEMKLEAGGAADPKRTRVIELEAYKKDGSTIWAEISLSFLRDKNQNPTGILSITRDITERKRTENAIARNEERYRMLVEESFDGIWIQKGFKIIFANRRLYEMLGYGEGELEGLDHWLVYHPDYQTLTRERAQARLRGEPAPPTYEVKFLRKDGSSFWGEIHAKAVPFLGEPGIQVWARDITERKRAEEAIKLSEEKFSKAFNASPAWVVISSLEEGRYLEVNDAFLKSTGFSREEVIGKISLELKIWANPEDRKRIISELKEKKFAKNVDVKLCKKSGELLDILLSAEIVEIAGQKYMLSTSLDITERKKAEEALKSSEERYRTLVESLSDAILLLDSERRIVSCNQAFCNLYGYEREEIEGKSARIIHRSDESYRSFGELAYPAVIKEGSFRGEWTFAHKDGAEIPVEVVISAIRSSDGVISGYVSVTRDMTGQKRREKEVASLQEQLRQSQKMEAIGSLAGGVAHDFNNILTVIKGVCQLSLLDLHERDPLYSNLKEIERSVERAADLTRQLLAFSRKQVLEPQVLDLNDIIKHLEKMFHRILGEDIELITFFAEGLGRVKVDPGQIEQVIINLAVNARDAMPKGGKLTIETANVELDEEYVRRHIGVKPGTYVMLSVSDTGVGMTQEVKERLFEPFFTTKEMGRGTGLGLSTVYGIVKQSGGNIWVYSEPGQGTTFKIYFPRVDEPLDEREEEAIKGIPQGCETILVVEDEESLRKLAVRLLKLQGYRVLEAPDGGQAFILCEKYHEPIHLILSDVVMPGMSGRELVERLQKIHPEARALYMSGYTDNVILHHGILEKGIEFIQKPFTLESLSRKVREVLDK